MSEISLMLSLETAAGQGDLDLVKHLVQHTDPKANHSRALVAAVREQRQDVVEFLAPLSDVSADGFQSVFAAMDRASLPMLNVLLPYWEEDPSDDALLVAAVETCNPEIVRLTLPYTNPKANGSSALKVAFELDEPAIANLLWPLSNVQSAGDALRDEEDWAALDRMGVNATPELQRRWLDEAPQGQLRQTEEAWRNWERAQTRSQALDQMATAGPSGAKRPRF